MKYYLDKINNSVFTISNFEYKLRKNQDVEITKEEYETRTKRTPKVPNEEMKKARLRRKRKPLLEAFDKWEKAVLRFREEDSKEIMTWYQSILDLKEETFNNVPERIKYYL